MKDWTCFVVLHEFCAQGILNPTGFLIVIGFQCFDQGYFLRDSSLLWLLIVQGFVWLWTSWAQWLQRDAKYNCYNCFKVFLKILYWNWMFIFTELQKKMVKTHIKFCLGKVDLLKFFNWIKKVHWIYMACGFKTMNALYIKNWCWLKRWIESD